MNTRLLIGVEGGASRTTAVLMTADGKALKRTEVGSCNLRLSRNTAVIAILRQIRRGLGNATPYAIGVFMAGCRTAADGRRLRKLVGKVWPRVRATVGSDASSAMAAALDECDGVVLICGTGSIVRARNGSHSSQVGGWGHIGGDSGSGYWLGRELVHHIFQHFDRQGALDPLGRATLRFLKFKTLDQLVQWSLDASKDEIASLTRVLFRYPRSIVTRRLCWMATDLLSEEVFLAARRVGLKAPRVALNRGLALHQPVFGRKLAAAIRQRMPHARVFLAQADGAVGAARLARTHFRVS
jgi:N-acetylglucosamine kinase-like BadF-type ATPase